MSVSVSSHRGKTALEKKDLLMLKIRNKSERRMDTASKRREQLRALEHGHRIRCATVEGWRSTPVDVPEDVAKVEARLAELGRC